MKQPARALTDNPASGFWLFVPWVAVCFAIYFWEIPPRPVQSFQNILWPFEVSSWTWTQVLQAWFSHFLFLLSLMGSLLAFLGAGNLFLSLVGVPSLTGLEKWVWSLALGFVFWGLLAEGLAFEKIFFPSFLRFLISTAIAGFLVFKRSGAIRRCWPFHDGIELPGFWLWPIGVVVLLSLSNLLSPEMSWDSITYQLILPKFYFLKHGFYPVDGMVPAHYPSLGQMFFSWGLLWKNDSLARSFCFLAHLGTALALVGIGSRLEKPEMGWVAGALYWVFPYLNIFSTRGYVDLFTGFYAALGLGYLIVWKQSPPEKEKEGYIGLLAFLALGAMWGLKYNAVSFWLVGPVLLALPPFAKKVPNFFWWMLFLSPAFFSWPWAIKSWFYTGDPFFPYLSRFFHPFDWTEFDEKASAIKFHVEGLRGLLELPFLPWKVIFENYGGAPNEELSLAPLVLFPLGVLRWNKIHWRTPYVIALGIPFSFWLVTSHQLRLLSGVIALFSIFLAEGYAYAVSRWSPFERSLKMIIGFLFWSCAFYLFQGLANQPVPFASSLGFETRNGFLNRILRPEGCVEASDNLNQNLPLDAKVLIIGQQNGYYLDRLSAYDFDYTYPVLKKLSEKSLSAAGLYKRFKENGFTHILYNSNAMMGTAIRVNELGVNRYPWKPEELKNYEQFFLKFTRKIPLPVADGYSLYEVAPRSGFSPLPEYLPGTEFYYLKNIEKAMGLSNLSEIVGKRIPTDAYDQAYEKVAVEHPEIGYPCFQWAFAQLSDDPESIRGALKNGREGFSRNGDKASWLTLQGDAFLAGKKASRAIPLLEEAGRLSPEREDVARNLAAAYYNERNLKKASQEADRAAALAPFSAEYGQLARQLKTVVSSVNR